VLANLLNNAAKYTPNGGRIQLVAGTEGNELLVRVSDTGMGIPADMLSRVFDMFTQVNRSIGAAQGGLGVGLTLVKRLVELHAGSIHAESAGIGQGSTFVLRLPLALAEVNAVSSPSGRTSEAATLRMLVVDDNVDAAESLAMLLEIEGHAIRLVHDGLAAIDAVREFQPDAVLLDLGLPGLDGFEVATRIRGDVSLRQPCLIALTGWGSDEDRKKALAAGFDHHLVKPVDLSRLQEVLAMTKRA
jgi:CheY-like chemotaxis protein